MQFSLSPSLSQLAEQMRPHASFGPCEVRYASGIRPGCRILDDLVLTASAEKTPDQPLEIIIGASETYPVNVLAFRTGLGGTVSLLEVANDSVPPRPRLDPPRRPVDFVPAVAARVDTAPSAGCLLGFINSNRIIDFIPTEGIAPPVGTPVFSGSEMGEFVGIAARKRSPPEQWVVTLVRLFDLLLEEDHRKEVENRTGMTFLDQLRALARSLKCEPTRLWTLYELAEDPVFKPHLAPAIAATAPPDATPADVPAAPAAAPVTAVARTSVAPRRDDTFVIDHSPPGLWVPLERAPRRFPLAPSVPVAWGIVVVLALAAFAAAALR